MTEPVAKYTVLYRVRAYFGTRGFERETFTSLKRAEAYRDACKQAGAQSVVMCSHLEREEIGGAQ